MKTILIATGNPGKKKEILECLGGLPKDEYCFLSLTDFPEISAEPEENGKTFEENAQIKAEFFGEASRQITIGEDSGLILEAFPEKFGIKTKREISAENDIEWLRKFLDLLENEENRRATFYSAFSVYDPDTQKSQEFLGITKGEIVEFPAAPIEKGIPVSAVFKPEGEIDVYSAMTKDQKNALSHRGKAARKMLEYLKNS